MYKKTTNIAGKSRLDVAKKMIKIDAKSSQTIIQGSTIKSIPCNSVADVLPDPQSTPPLHPQQLGPEKSDSTGIFHHESSSRSLRSTKLRSVNERCIEFLQYMSTFPKLVSSDRAKLKVMLGMQEKPTSD